jgi:hypothetical protein
LGADADAVLMGNGLVRATVRDPNVFVPVIIIHRFLEEAARAVDEPHFGVHMGERSDLAGWPPFVFVPASPALTVGTAHVLAPDRVTRLAAGVSEVTGCVSQWGIGSRKVLKD